MMSVPISIIYCLLTLYMMAVLLRWLGPWLELEFHGPLLRAVPRAVDPLLEVTRRYLPHLGPVDLSPLVAVLGLYIVRLIVTNQ